MSHSDSRVQPKRFLAEKLIRCGFFALVFGFSAPEAILATTDSGGAATPLDLDVLHGKLEWSLRKSARSVDLEVPEPVRLLRLKTGMRTFLDEETPPAPASPRGYPSEWGSYSILLALDRRQIGDTQELEKGFTNPQFLSLSTLDYMAALGQSGYLDLGLRNVTDQDPRASLTLENDAHTRLDLDLSKSRFRDLPSDQRTVRHEAGARVEFRKFVGLRLPFSLEVEELPIRLGYRQRRLQGEAALDTRDWDYTAYELGTELDAGLFRLGIAFPFSHFSDNLDGINSNSHYGGQSRLVGRYKENRASFGVQLSRFEIGQRPDPETRLVVDLNLVNPKVYGIRGLTSRSRMSLVRRWDELALTGRVKSGYEAHSRLTYQPQERFRNFRFETGTHSRRSAQRRLLRPGIDTIPAPVDPASRLELDFFTDETTSTMTEGWMSVSYRGIPGVKIHAGIEGATLTNPPLTDLGGVGFPTLYHDRRDGLFLDVTLNSDSPVWGVTYKGKAQNRRNTTRDLGHTWQNHALVAHFVPHPRVTLTGSVFYTGFESTSDVVSEGLSNTTGLSSAIHYVFSERGALFADVQANTASGRYAGTETILNAGFEARSRKDGDDSYRLIYTSARLGSRSDLLVPYKQHLITLMRTQCF